jgi:hypothetical protein
VDELLVFCRQVGVEARHALLEVVADFLAPVLALRYRRIETGYGFAYMQAYYAHMQRRGIDQLIDESY